MVQPSLIDEKCSAGTDTDTQLVADKLFEEGIKFNPQSKRLSLKINDEKEIKV